MNWKIIFFVLFSLQVSAQSTTVNEYLHYGPFETKVPALLDTLDINRRAFDVKTLMSETLPVSVFSGSGTVIAANDTGFIAIKGNEKLHISGLLTFYIDALNFSQPEIKFEGLPNAARIYLNGRNRELRNNAFKPELEPVRHEIVIKYIVEPYKTYNIKTTITDATLPVPDVSVNPSKRYSIYDVVEGRRIQSANISPDGKHVLVDYFEVFSDGRRIDYSILKEIRTGKNVRMNISGLRWMPVSPKLFYTREGATGRELITIDPITMQEEKIASGLPTASFTLSPTEEYIIFSRTDTGPAETDNVRQVLAIDDRSRGWRNRATLHMYIFKTGNTQRLLFGNMTTSLQDISNNGRYILFSTWNSDYTDVPFIRRTFCRLDLSDMTVDTLIFNDKSVDRIKFSPDAKQLLVTGAATAFDGIGLNLPEGRITNYYDKQLFIFDIETRRATALTKDFDPSIRTAEWNVFDNLIYITCEVADRVLPYTIDPLRGRITAIPVTEDMTSGMSISRTTPELVYFGVGLSNTHRLYAVDTRRNQERLLDDVSAEVLKNIRLGHADDWNFTSAGGDVIQGRYYLPVDFDAEKKYPMIVYYYGGTNPTTRRLEGHYPPHVYAGMGFVVYVLQPSGATGFGQEFASRHVNDWGKQTADEIIEGTMKFCDAHPFVDRDKIGCVGASYGGFMTMYLLTVTDIFAAGISHAGISSLSSYWGEGLSGHSYSAIASAGSYPWNAHWLYAQQSPLFNADKINTPLLLLHGSVDTNVPPGQSFQMFVALQILGKEAALVVVEGENHGIFNHQNRIKWSNTMYAWFAKWLKDRPEWWEHLYKKPEHFP